MYLCLAQNQDEGIFGAQVFQSVYFDHFPHFWDLLKLYLPGSLPLRLFSLLQIYMQDLCK